MPHFALIIMFYHVKIACYQGLSSTRNFKCAGHVAEGGALDQTENDRSAWIVWTPGPPDLIKHTCFKEGVIMAQINARGEHPHRRIAIKCVI